MVAFLSMTFGKLSVSPDFDASRVEGLDLPGEFRTA